MADWLRPVFARKTPNLSALPYAERQATPSIDESVEGDEVAVTPVTKMRSTSRVSSIMGGFRPNSPSVAMPDVFQGIKDPESTYHRPNSDQESYTPYLCLCLGDTSHATGIFGQGRMLTIRSFTDGRDSSGHHDEPKYYGLVANQIQRLYFARPGGLLRHATTTQCTARHH